MESIDSRLGDDLLDDVLIAPSKAHNAMPSNADEVHAVYFIFISNLSLVFLQLLGVKIDDEAMEGLSVGCAYCLKFCFTFCLYLIFFPSKVS